MHRIDLREYKDGKELVQKLLSLNLVWKWLTKAIGAALNHSKFLWDIALSKLLAETLISIDKPENAAKHLKIQSLLYSQKAHLYTALAKELQLALPEFDKSSIVHENWEPKDIIKVANSSSPVRKPTPEGNNERKLFTLLANNQFKLFQKITKDIDKDYWYRFYCNTLSIAYKNKKNRNGHDFLPYIQSNITKISDPFVLTTCIRIATKAHDHRFIRTILDRLSWLNVYHTNNWLPLEQLYKWYRTLCETKEMSSEIKKEVYSIYKRNWWKQTELDDTVLQEKREISQVWKEKIVHRLHNMLKSLDKTMKSNSKVENKEFFDGLRTNYEAMGYSKWRIKTYLKSICDYLWKEYFDSSEYASTNYQYISMYEKKDWEKLARAILLLARYDLKAYENIFFYEISQQINDRRVKGSHLYRWNSHIFKQIASWERVAIDKLSCIVAK